MAAQTLSRAQDEKWERKLSNWALWRIGRAHERIDAPVYRELDEQKIRDAWRTYTPPTPEPQALIGEALDVDDLIWRLDDELRRAVEANYCWTGTMRERAAALGCHVDTLYSRVTRAKIELERLDGVRRHALPRPPGMVAL